MNGDNPKNATKKKVLAFSDLPTMSPYRRLLEPLYQFVLLGGHLGRVSGGHSQSFDTEIGWALLLRDSALEVGRVHNHNFAQELIDAREVA